MSPRDPAWVRTAGPGSITSWTGLRLGWYHENAMRPMRPVPGAKMFTCSACKDGRQMTAYKARVHGEAVHLGLRYICPLCDLVVAAKDDLHKHMRHSGVTCRSLLDAAKKDPDLIAFTGVRLQTIPGLRPVIRGILIDRNGRRLPAYPTSPDDASLRTGEAYLMLPRAESPTEGIALVSA